MDNLSSEYGHLFDEVVTVGVSQILQLTSQITQIGVEQKLQARVVHGSLVNHNFAINLCHVPALAEHLKHESERFINTRSTTSHTIYLHPWKLGTQGGVDCSDYSLTHEVELVAPINLA